MSSAIKAGINLTSRRHHPCSAAEKLHPLGATLGRTSLSVVLITDCYLLAHCFLGVPLLDGSLYIDHESAMIFSRAVQRPSHPSLSPEWCNNMLEFVAGSELNWS